jgi:hypothetical protein
MQNRPRRCVQKAVHNCPPGIVDGQ